MGNIAISTGDLTLVDSSLNGSLVTEDDLMGGNIIIDAPNFIVTDNNPDSSDRPGGTITIEAKDLIVDGGEITISFSGTARSERLVGTLGKDVIAALAGNDTVFGLAEDDSLFGGLGNDILNGGLGEDDLFGGAGNDILSGLAGEDDLFGGLNNDSIFGGFGNDDLFGENGDDRIAGGGGNDDLIGGEGNDFLFGGGGNDELFSGVGRDTLVGGTGRDEFIFSSTTGRDRIEDFVPTQDEILLNRLSFGLASVVGRGFSVVNEFAIVNTNIAAADSIAKIVYNRVSGALFYNANRNLAGLGQNGELLATLVGAPSLNRGNFEIINGLSGEVFD